MKLTEQVKPKPALVYCQQAEPSGSGAAHLSVVGRARDHLQHMKLIRHKQQMHSQFGKGAPGTNKSPALQQHVSFILPLDHKQSQKSIQKQKDLKEKHSGQKLYVLKGQNYFLQKRTGADYRQNAIG